jgi:hypothetical protein
MMKVDLQSVDLTQFYVNEHVLNGETVYLVIPQQIGAKWTKENKVFRSSVWDSNGELISAGFPKFTNWGEAPEVFPLPTSLKNCTIMEKIDGSLLIVSKWKGCYILRTRGTIDATQLENGHELEIFKQTILPIIDKFAAPYTSEKSWLFEWTSPLQKIILNCGDVPEWCLVGAVYHDNYSLETQDVLDSWAKQYGFKRPATYTFSTIEDLLANVDQWKGKEGVCVYSNNGQSIHKVKSAWYLALHHMKSELASKDKVIDVWFSFGKPGYTEFYGRVSSQFDHELAEQIRGDISNICDAYKEVEKIVEGMNRFVKDTCLLLGNPKDKKIRGQMAGKVLSSYGQTNRANFVFKLLDGKQLNDEDLKKLLWQILKK